MDFKDVNNFLSSVTQTGSSEENLRKMLNLYTFVYQQLGTLAVRYGNGTHPKHRLTKYHDFFVNNVGKHETVLDLGSGRGDVTHDVSKKTDGEVVGIELNISNLNYAKSTYQRSNLKFFHGDIYKDVPNSHFDVIIMSNILEHLSDRDSLLLNICKKTTPVKVLLRVPYFERDWTVAMKKEMGLNYFLDDTHKVEYTLDQFDEEMGRASLQIASKIVNWGEIWAVMRPKK